MSNRSSQIEKIFSSFLAIKRKMVTEFHSGKLNITGAQCQVLFVIKHDEGIGVKELAEKMGISPSAATQLVDALVDGGHLERENSGGDRRTISIKLSPAVSEHLRSIRSKGLNKVAVLFEDLSDVELEIFCKISQKIENKILAERKEEKNAK